MVRKEEKESNHPITSWFESFLHKFHSIPSPSPRPGNATLLCPVSSSPLPLGLKIGPLPGAGGPSSHPPTHPSRRGLLSLPPLPNFLDVTLKSNSLSPQLTDTRTHSPVTEEPFVTPIGACELRPLAQSHLGQTRNLRKAFRFNKTAKPQFCK